MVAVEPDAIQQREGGLNVLGRKTVAQRGEQADIAEPAREHILHHAQPLHQIVFLEDHANPAARGAQALAVERDDVVAIEQDAPGGRLDQPVDAADEGALAGARRADHRDELGPVDHDIDVVERLLACRIGPC